MVVSNIFVFSSLLGEDEPNLTNNIFQKGWFNHRLEKDGFVTIYPKKN